MLPEITRHIIQRPGINVPREHYIANPDESEFWGDFYGQFAAEMELAEPVAGFARFINPYFGSYGYRWHPVAKRARYFHVGIDVGVPAGTPICSVADGWLEYSGYADVNGRYVVVCHPQIQTSDGFVLQSLYLHCQEIYVGFNMGQKIMREFLTKKASFSNVAISSRQRIATVGGSGHELGYNPHLHLQFELVRKGMRVSLSPLRLYNMAAAANLTSDIKDLDEYLTFRNQHADDLKAYDRFY